MPFAMVRIFANIFMIASDLEAYSSTVQPKFDLINVRQTKHSRDPYLHGDTLRKFDRELLHLVRRLYSDPPKADTAGTEAGAKPHEFCHEFGHGSI